MPLRQLLPFDRFTLSTKLNATEALARVAHCVEPKRMFGFTFFDARVKPYEGDINGKSFIINRIIRYRNSFNPVITGQVVTRKEHTDITISMHPTVFVLVCTSIWLCFTGVMCLSVLSDVYGKTARPHAPFSKLHYIPFVLFVFGWLLATVAYRMESRKSRKFFANLFNEEKSGV